MLPFDDIQYNHGFYSRFDSLFVLLCYIEGFDLTERVNTIDDAVGVHPDEGMDSNEVNRDIIRINNLHLLDFVNSFEDTSQCRREISRNYPKTYTLFVYFDNIETWLHNNHPINDNLETIIVFYPNDSAQYTRDWIRRYRKIKKIVTYKQLETELLIVGMNYLNFLCDDLDEDCQTCIILRRKQHRMCLVLSTL